MGRLSGIRGARKPAGGTNEWRRKVDRLASTRRLEAVQAVHRTRPSRYEGHLRGLAAVGANHVMHDPHPASVPVGSPSGGPALRAATGFVLQPSGLIELLLPGRE